MNQTLSQRLTDLQNAAEMLRDRAAELAVDMTPGEVNDTVAAAMDALNAAARLLQLAAKEVA